MGYTRIEASRAGRHLPRPYGERDMGLRMTRVCRTRGRTGAAEGNREGAPAESNREGARRRVIERGRQASGNPPTPRAPDKSGQSDCPVMKERETPRYHAERETDKGFRTEVRADCRMAMRVRPKREVSHMIKI